MVTELGDRFGRLGVVGGNQGGAVHRADGLEGHLNGLGLAFLLRLGRLDFTFDPLAGGDVGEVGAGTGGGDADFGGQGGEDFLAGGQRALGGQSGVGGHEGGFLGHGVSPIQFRGVFQLTTGTSSVT